MKEQAQLYGAAIEDGFVSRIESGDGGFVAEWGSGPVAAKTVLLATGVTNRRPPMDEAAHDDALAAGLIRYCPICDGYEVTDKNVAVIGSGRTGRGGDALPASLHRRPHVDRARQRCMNCRTRIALA